jgi:YVTN family beta-propeller protein
MPRYIAWPTILIAVVVGAASAATALKPARIVARIATGQTPCSENGGLGALWVSNFRDATIARIDPTTNRVTGRIKVGPQPCGVVVGAGALWVGSHAGKSIYRVDPSTNKARAVPVGLLSPDSIAVSDAAIWVTSSADRVAVRLNPKALRVVARVTVGLARATRRLPATGACSSRTTATAR